MSNAILNAQASSAVCSTINESGGLVNPFVYQESGRLAPPHSVQVLNITPSGGSFGASKSITFDIAKNGMLTGCWLKLTMPQPTGDAERDATDTEASGQAELGSGALQLDTANESTFHALGFYKYIQEVRLETSGRVVESLDQYSMMARISDLPYGKRRAVEQSALMAGDVPRDNSYDVCLWLPFYFSSDPRYSPNTVFAEPHRVVVTFSNLEIFHKEDAQGGGESNIEKFISPGNSTDQELICKYHQLADKDLDATVSANQADGLLSQLVPIMKSEATFTSTPPATTSTSAKATKTETVELKENDAVSAIYVCVTQEGTEQSSHGNTVASALRHQAPLEITRIKLTFNGTAVMDVPGTWLQYFGRVTGGDGTDSNAPSGMQHIYKIDFGLLDLGAGSTSNCVALREISSPRLEVTYVYNNPATVPVAAQPHHIHVRYETRAFLTTNSNSGRVQLSISS